MNGLSVPESFISQAATVIHRYGWQTPALIFLGAGHPFTFLSGQLLWLAQPALSLVMPSDIVRQTALLLEEPEAVQVLITKLETEGANPT